MIELPDGSRTQKTFRTKKGAKFFKKRKKIEKGKVIKVTFRSAQ